MKLQTQQKVNIGLIQLSADTDKQKTVDKTIQSVRKAAAAGANVICLQELFATVYFCQTVDAGFFGLAESVDGPTVTSMRALAAELNVVLIVPFFEKRAAGVYYNTAVVIDADGSLNGIYRKMHIPDDPGFYEKYYFTPGDLGYKMFKTKYANIGVLICWDQWYPEAARLTAMQGADILFYPTAIGVLKSETENEKKEYRDAWETIQRSHAIANGCYVASVNRVGTEDNLTFWGDSFVCGPFGQILAQAGDTEEILTLECDLGQIETQRQAWPYFRDRRIDSYSGITNRFSND